MKTSNLVVKSFRHTSNNSGFGIYEKANDNYNPFAEGNSWYKKHEMGFKFPKRRVEDNEKSCKVNELEPIAIDLLGEKILVPKQLQDIIDEINFSKELLDFQHDWDFQGGLRLDPTLYKEVIIFLLQYSEYLLKSKNTLISSPEINLCPNGSLDLSWATKSARLLINIKKDAQGVISGRFFGFTKPVMASSPRIEKEGAIDMTVFDEVLAVWMKSLV